MLEEDDVEEVVDDVLVAEVVVDDVLVAEVVVDEVLVAEVVVEDDVVVEDEVLVLDEVVDVVVDHVNAASSSANESNSAILRHFSYG